MKNAVHVVMMVCIINNIFKLYILKGFYTRDLYKTLYKTHLRFFLEGILLFCNIL